MPLFSRKNRSDAEDLVQETCVRAIRALGRLRAWLFTILRNIWLNELRPRRKAPEILDIEADDGNPGLVDENRTSPHDAYVGKLQRRHVREAMRQLPEDAREIILLREWEELSYGEIATVLDWLVGTVMSRLARARSKLRDLLSSFFEDRHPCLVETEATE